jgi:hypothetical protein
MSGPAQDGWSIHSDDRAKNPAQGKFVNKRRCAVFALERQKIATGANPWRTK